MNNDSRPIRLDRLILKNFRVFSELDISFHPNLTVLVAENGGGKTAVLDGVAIAWRLFVNTLESRAGSWGFSHSDVRRIRSSDGTMQSVLPTSLNAKGLVDGRNLDWYRELSSDRHKAKTTYADASNLKEIATDLRLHLEDYAEKKRPDSPVLPLLCYYGTARLWGTHKLTVGKSKADTSRISGYDDCLSALSRYKIFLDWFARFSREAQQEQATGKPSPHQPFPKLQAVRSAVDAVLRPCGWHSLEWDFAEETIVANHPEFGRLPVDQLSDGIRNILGLVADMAHRATRLNPVLGEDAARRTPGLVMIDEVDMHLHPTWQQVVLKALLEAFPNFQFIVTTHSPQVLTTVPKENIRKLTRDELGRWSAPEPEHSPLAQESSDALVFVMGSHPRPQVPLLDDVQAYEQLARSGRSNSQEAKAIKQRLDVAGFEFSEADLSLFAFLAKKSGPTTEDPLG